MFDQFSGPSLPQQGILSGPKEIQFDRKSWAFANVNLRSVSYPLINTTTVLTVLVTKFGVDSTRDLKVKKVRVSERCYL